MAWEAYRSTGMHAPIPHIAVNRIDHLQLNSLTSERPFRKADRFYCAEASFVGPRRVVHRDERGEVILTQRGSQFLKHGLMEWDVRPASPLAT